ncbi:hypothetical protein EQH45_08700 [Streptococcus pneumoniae]|nr:hypothetical protein EQH46_08480 [Streptococcus pneumoniae]UKP18708.1 hypothetical protein EQH45_08700 [Streptococcus pneumoniae]
MGLFFYTKIGSIISIRDLPTTNIIEPINKKEQLKNYCFFVTLDRKTVKDNLAFCHYSREMLFHRLTKRRHNGRPRLTNRFFWSFRGWKRNG